jgi:hypothetical protein
MGVHIPTGFYFFSDEYAIRNVQENQEMIKTNDLNELLLYVDEVNFWEGGVNDTE